MENKPPIVWTLSPEHAQIVADCLDKCCQGVQGSQRVLPVFGSLMEAIKESGEAAETKAADSEQAK